MLCFVCPLCPRHALKALVVCPGPSAATHKTRRDPPTSAPDTAPLFKAGRLLLCLSACSLTMHNMQATVARRSFRASVCLTLQDFFLQGCHHIPRGDSDPPWTGRLALAQVLLGFVSSVTTHPDNHRTFEKREAAIQDGAGNRSCELLFQKYRDGV